ncbi:MAG: GNAT family N-acetyltransferase [Amaricoccus sp.]|uniref:GNAT family N-acetyltransferase n=1 Tax=Amaricoccus sp. TaxID=1872485 RepID=UPI0039E55AA8
MTPEALAALHASAFTEAPRPWSAAEFADLLADPAVLLVAEPDGFALARRAGPEVELLTLAVAPPSRRRGLATGLLDQLCRRAAAAGAEEMLLEVAEPNTAARALYQRAGFVEVGRRPRYYTRRSGPPLDALVLRRTLQF